MKEIYKLLNKVQLDDKEFIELEASEFEKAQVKKRLQQSISKKKKMGGRWRQVAVAALFIGLSGMILGFTFPAQAGTIPIVRDIFKFIDGDRASLYENYKEFSTAVELSDKSKGVEITINDAIYDGETIFVTYSIKSEQTLGEQPAIRDHRSSLKDADGMSWGETTTRVDDHNYVGMLKVGNFGQNVGDTGHLVWKIDKIFIAETNTVINGNWRFAFSVDATEQYTQIVNKSTELDGIKITIEQLTNTPMSVIVYVRQQLEQQVLDYWDSVSLEFTMQDDVGNVYEGVDNGGRGYPYDMRTGGTFEKIDERATTLTIVPHVRLIKFSENVGEQTEGTNAFGESFVSNTSTEALDHKEMTLDPIIIDLQK